MSENTPPTKTDLSPEEQLELDELFKPQWGLGCALIGGPGLLAVGGYVSAVSLFLGGVALESYHPLMRMRETVHTTADEILSTYQEDEAKGDRRYGRSPLHLKAKVDRVKEDDFGTSVNLGASGVHSLWTDLDDLPAARTSTWSQGQVVNLICFGARMEPGAPREEAVQIVLEDCSIAPARAEISN